MTRHKLRHLPSIDSLLQSDTAQSLSILYGRQMTLDTLRHTLDTTRQALLNGDDVIIDTQTLLHQAQSQLEQRFQPTLRPVLNATGVIIHTNLGRAILSQEAQHAVQAIASNYSNLEFNLDSGKRGSRYLHAEELLKDLTGAESALVVNNNASALVLALSALAHAQGVIISRSQLVEIGGGFRIPDIMTQSGAHLIEVGTTNRTRITDYADAIDEQSAMLLRVHSSNFKIIGFVETPNLSEMAQTAHQHHILCVDDLGSGAMLNTENYGLLHEPTVQESVQAGCDLVMFSGDKLLGGPQAGIMLGRADVIARLKKHPLARAMRADKLCYAGLSATLDHYRRNEVTEKIPVWRMMSASLDHLKQRAEAWRDAIGVGQVISGESTVGGGSLPGATLPTHLLALEVASPDAFTARLREGAAPSDQPVIVRISEGRVLFDPRTVFTAQSDVLLNVLRAARA